MDGWRQFLFDFGKLIPFDDNQRAFAHPQFFDNKVAYDEVFGVKRATGHGGIRAYQREKRLKMARRKRTSQFLIELANSARKERLVRFAMTSEQTYPAWKIHARNVVTKLEKEPALMVCDDNRRNLAQRRCLTQVRPPLMGPSFSRCRQSRSATAQALFNTLFNSTVNFVTKPVIRASPAARAGSTRAPSPGAIVHRTNMTLSYNLVSAGRTISTNRPLFILTPEERWTTCAEQVLNAAAKAGVQRAKCGLR
jgi:hypothetical protein